MRSTQQSAFAQPNRGIWQRLQNYYKAQKTLKAVLTYDIIKSQKGAGKMKMTKAYISPKMHSELYSSKHETEGRKYHYTQELEQVENVVELRNFRINKKTGKKEPVQIMIDWGTK